MKPLGDLIFQPATNNRLRLEIYSKMGLRRYSQGTKHINYLIKYWIKNPNADISFKKVYSILREYSSRKGLDFEIVKKDIHKELKHLESVIPTHRKYLQKISIYLVQSYDFIGDRKLITELIRGIINQL